MVRFVVGFLLSLSLTLSSLNTASAQATLAPSIGLGAEVVGAGVAANYCRKHPFKCLAAGAVVGGIWVLHKKHEVAKQAADSKATNTMAPTPPSHDPCGNGQGRNPSQQIADAFSNYLDELQSETGVRMTPQQRNLVTQSFNRQQFQKIDRVQYAKNLKEFSDLKTDLRAEWTRNTGQAWPNSRQQIKMPDGTFEWRTVAYDAHHIVELDRGGANSWWNMFPTQRPNVHQAIIHGKDRTLDKLKNLVDKFASNNGGCK